MANPISGDNFPAHQAIKSRNFDTRPGDRGETDAGKAQPTAAGDTTSVGRAQQRFSQEVEAARPGDIESVGEARARIAALQLLIATNAGAVLQAHGRIDSDLVQAATARPTA